MKTALRHVAKLMSDIRKGKNAVLYVVKKIHLIGKHPLGRRWAMLLSLILVLINQECILNRVLSFIKQGYVLTIGPNVMI